jgi:hypothetical protein
MLEDIGDVDTKPYAHGKKTPTPSFYPSLVRKGGPVGGTNVTVENYLALRARKKGPAMHNSGWGLLVPRLRPLMAMASFEPSPAYRPAAVTASMNAHAIRTHKI